MRLTVMPSRMVATALLSALAVHLSGCDQGAPAPAASDAAASSDAPVAAASAAPPPAAAQPGPAASASAPSPSRNPQEVVVAWAKAISLKDWDAAYAYWGDHGARSGLSREAHAAQWAALTRPDLEIGKGTIEGAAGSSFYTVPVTVIDGKRRIRGEVVLRRVNDVPGATDEQLRWHIVSSTLKP